MGGFDSDLRCKLLDTLVENQKSKILKIKTEYIFNDSIKKKYTSLELKFDVGIWLIGNYIKSFETYREHPKVNPKNFVCSFNGAPHVGRKLLTSALDKFGWFDPKYSTKNFTCTEEQLDGHIMEIIGGKERVYRKFFITKNKDFLSQVINSDYRKSDHPSNLRVLETPLTQSFIHLVSETMATSYYPFFTEKFLYSVVTRGLFLAYAQPGWHEHLEKNFGFKKYSLFDYKFDSISNPVERLIELLSMISKYSALSTSDWHDLYLTESDTIEYNYENYFSCRYLDVVKQHILKEEKHG